MNETLFKLCIGAVILIYVVWRFVYSPRFTSDALRWFVVDSLKSRQFEDFTTSRRERIRVGNRTAHARWSVHKSKDASEMIIAFEVLPSALPFSLGATEVIHVRNREHFEKMQAALQQSTDDSSFVANDKIIKEVMSPDSKA